MRRRGVALISALMLLSLLGLLTAGGFAAAVAVRRDGRLAKAQAAVVTDADAAIGNVLSTWSALAPTQLAVGQTQTQLLPGLNSGALDTVSVTRLPLDVYWLAAAAPAVLPERAYRRVNLLVRLPPLQTPPTAAVTSSGSVGIGSGVVLDRDTTRQGGASCGQSAANVVLGPGASLVAQSGGSIGSIAAVNQATAGDTTSYALLPQGWASFGARAGVQYQPGSQVTLGPGVILYGGGDLVVTGGSGQGLLLVEGRLTVNGPTFFNGLIVARGGITINASTDVTGAVMSVATGTGAVLLQSAAIHYSACRVAQAIEAATAPRPVRGRSWAEMF